MANLKGGSYEKQLKDAFHRLSAFGEKRHNTNSHKTHSSKLNLKREEFGRSFAKYLTDKGLDGKINTHMTTENIKEFLEQRTQNLAYSTTENYIRGFSSFITGLQESNISIDCDKKVFDAMVKNLKDTEPKPELETGRAIDSAEKIIEQISNTHNSLSLVASVQLELGLRVSEAYEVVNNFEKYYNEENQTLEKIVGKGNLQYDSKPISDNLVRAIQQNSEELPTLRTYANILDKYEISSHDFRYTFAKNFYEEKTSNSENHKDILKELSRQLNHSRESMSKFYLSKL
jgi:integrase